MKDIKDTETLLTINKILYKYKSASFIYLKDFKYIVNKAMLLRRMIDIQDKYEYYFINPESEIIDEHYLDIKTYPPTDSKILYNLNTYKLVEDEKNELEYRYGTYMMEFLYDIIKNKKLSMFNRLIRNTITF